MTEEAHGNVMDGHLFEIANIKWFLLIYFTFCLLIFPIIAASAFVYGSSLDPNSYQSEHMLVFLVHVCCSSGIGGTIFCILSFNKHLIDNDFKDSYIWWYYFRPLMAAVVGVFVFFLIAGTVISLNPSVNGSDFMKNYSSTFNTVVMFYLGIAFLTGFAFNDFINKLYDLSSTLFSSKTANKIKIEGKIGDLDDMDTPGKKPSP